MEKDKCKFCKSENVEAIRQYSDEEGKIVTRWKCMDCKRKFETRW